jgi:hypothetical protein
VIKLSFLPIFMKKVLLTSAAFVALATSTYAQVINQQGQQQLAQHNQFGANQTGIINQIQAPGDPNRVNYGNYAITFQGTPSNTGTNTLVINQNDGSQGNRAGIGQSGGPGNNATISQSGGIHGLSGGATSASATIGAPGEDGNFAGIAQTGAANTAIIMEDNNSRRNKAEIYQNGTANSATTSQSNNSINNTAYIFQGYLGANTIGTAINNAVAIINQGKIIAGAINFYENSPLPEATNNMATITQLASNVYAEIGQGDITSQEFASGRADGVRATITQLATQNRAGIFQGTYEGEAVNSTATILQTAQGNTAVITQGASDKFLSENNAAGGVDYKSVATITQNSSAGVGTNNAEIHEGIFGGNSELDQATITQTGAASNVEAIIYQGYGYGSFSSQDKATITQSGKNANAHIEQNSGGQSNGNNNTATIEQGVGVTGIGETITQAVIYQSATISSEVIQGSRNTASISQVSGANLQAAIHQGFLEFQDASANPLFVNGLNGTTVTLVGTIATDNIASITQTSGDNHNANIFQTGRYNSATVAQANGNAHQALIVQTSNAQRAMASVTQTSTGTGNSATILQFAGSNADGVGPYGNMTTISQVSGSNNVAFVQQGIQGAASSSNDNVASITQNGSGNFARFLQVGNNNFVNITQNGNNNQVLNLAGDPGSYGSQQGYNNRLTLVQEGGTTGIIFKYTQIGNNNTQVVNQHF